MKTLTTLFLIITLSISAFEKTTYDFTTDPVDVVIPCHEKDVVILDQCIDGIRKYGDNIGRIIVVSMKEFTEQAEWFDESLFPFTIAEINNHFMSGKQKHSFMSHKLRTGWIFQQLLKLYAPLIIPDISPNVLVLDADTVFMNPVSFLQEDGSGLYAIDDKHTYKAFWTHMKYFVPELTPVFKGKSGVCHHMLFQRTVINDLFQVVEEHHQKPFWLAFCDNHNTLARKLPSEYDIYFNYVFSRTDQVKVRPLKWKNSPELNKIENFRKEGYHFVSFHHYLRGVR